VPSVTQMPQPYIYSLSGRRPMTLAGLAVAIGLVALGWENNAPWFALAPAVIAASMLLGAIVWNPVYGMRLDRQALQIDLNGRAKRIPLAAINHIKITRWTDSSDATIHLTDGTMYQIPDLARPSTDRFHQVLVDHGIAVTLS
jgi:hypothetical protein